MSWFRQTGLIFFLCCFISACGFTPVYAPNGDGNVLFGQTHVVTPATPNGYRLLRALEGRIGNANSSTQILEITSLQFSIDGVAVGHDQSETRNHVNGTAGYKYTHRNGDILTGTVQGFTGYSLTSTTIATQTAEADAYERLMSILAQRVEQDLLVQLSSDP